jgi:hypothetical protein
MTSGARSPVVPFVTSMDTSEAREGGIRPAVDADLESIVALDARVYADHVVTPERTANMKEVLFAHPWRTERLPSLVYEEGGGRMRGFIGIMPRRMRFNDRELLAGISHRFMVDPESRGYVGLTLMKAFIQGNHDLSITEPENEAARRIWLRYGGVAVESQSLQWTKPIRPAGWAAQYAQDRLPGLAVRALGGVAAGLDGVAGRVAGLRPDPAAGTAEELTPEAMQAVLEESTSRFAVRPAYDLRQLAWFLRHLRGKRGRGDLRARLVSTPDGKRAGYFLYYVRRGGTGLVVQLLARGDRIKLVWTHLLADAWHSGTVALRGKYDAMMATLGDRGMLIRRARHTFLFHTRHPDVERAVLRGDALLTRLEGEGGIPFGDDPTAGLPGASDGA